MGAKIYNSELQRELIDAVKIQTSKDRVPDEIADKVVPTVETNHRLLAISNIVKVATATNSTSATIYTVPTGTEFYLTSASISLIKDATSTSLNTAIAITIDGAATNILNIATLTLTAGAYQNSLSFPFPIKVDSGTSITLSNNTNVANIVSKANITGYLVYNPRA